MGPDVFWYFVPLACLALPYMAMKELLQASMDPIRWPIVEPPRVLSVWWGAWMLYSILSVQEAKLSFRNPAVDVPLLSALVAVSLCGASLALARLIGTIQESQKSRVDPRPPAAVRPRAVPEAPQPEEP